MKSRIVNKIMKVGAALLTGATLYMASPNMAKAETVPTVPNAEAIVEQEENSILDRFHTKINLKTGFDRFYDAPKKLEDFEACSTKLSLTETVDLTDKLQAEATGSIRVIDNPFFSNERYGSDDPEITLDKAMLKYHDKGFEASAGKIDDPFKTNPVSYDKDLNPEGIAVVYTKKGVGSLNLLRLAAAVYDGHDINNNPNAELVKGEVFAVKRLSDYLKLATGASYTVVGDIDGPLRTNSEGEKYRFVEAGGKLFISTGNEHIPRITVFANYVHNFANGDESQLAGARADLLGSKVYIDGAVFDKDQDPFPAAISHDNIPPTNCDGYKIGAGVDVLKALGLKVPGLVRLEADANWYNPTLNNGQEVQHWDVSASMGWKF